MDEIGTTMAMGPRTVKNNWKSCYGQVFQMYREGKTKGTRSVSALTQEHCRGGIITYCE
jgi:hypothetical protein